MQRDEKRLYAQAKQLLQDTTGTPEETIAQLREAINYADWKYYVQSEPVLADEEYDKLFKKLKALEEQYPEQVTADSPTQRVALGLSEKFPAVAHLVPMLSLDNTYNAEDLRDWDKRCRQVIKDEQIQYCVEPKYDGASISLVYEDDKLLRGATRGDGVMGEEVTTNIRQIRSLPLSAGFGKDGVQHMEIRGEVVIHKEVFAEYNRQRAAEGLSPLANPRNAASGTLRILDPKEVGRRRLSAVLYHIADYSLLRGREVPEALTTHYGSLQWLYQLGYPTPVKEMQVFDTIDEVIDYCEKFEARRDDLPFEVDGLVIKVNSFELQDRLGMTTHHPRWAVAYKFSARQATSKLLNVEFQVGRTGSITPVAKIEPVPIGGVTVTSVSLFNEDVIKEKNLKIGDKVLVERAGDVIPYIVKSFEELRDGSERDIKFPTECPVCDTPLVRPEGEAVWRCDNATCPTQVVERIIHFASKDAMDIRSLGAANIEKFYKLGLLADIPGIYNIDWEEVGKLGGFGAKSVTNLQAAIEASKQQPLNRVIFGLGIRYVGETTAKTLARAVNHIKELYTWDDQDYLKLEDVGPKVAGSVAHFFRNPDNIAMLQRLEDAGVNLANHHTEHKQAGGGLTGKSFLFTGTLTHFKRSEAEEMVEQRGGTLLSGVSSKLNYLVVGTDAGSKLEKAKKLGTVTILTEQEFLKLVEGEGV